MDNKYKFPGMLISGPNADATTRCFGSLYNNRMHNQFRSRLYPSQLLVFIHPLSCFFHVNSNIWILYRMEKYDDLLIKK